MLPSVTITRFGRHKELWEERWYVRVVGEGEVVCEGYGKRRGGVRGLWKKER